MLADPPIWEDDPGAYEFTATISGGVVLNEGVQMGDDGDLFAAFDDDGNVRGIAITLYPPFGPYQGTPVYEMQMRSNAGGDLLSFKYYDASEDAVLDIVETYDFEINDIVGDLVDPVFYNIGPGIKLSFGDYQKESIAYRTESKELFIIDIMIDSDTPIAGFQFDVTGVKLNDVYGGIANVDNNVVNDNGDQDEYTVALTYAVGGFTLGYQWSEADLGTTTGAQQYDNDGYGITFAINDDLSIGYNHYESEQTNTTNVTNEATSMQIAYSVGGASIRLAEGQSDNQDYQTGAAYDRDNTILSVSLAF